MKIFMAIDTNDDLHLVSEEDAADRRYFIESEDVRLSTGLYQAVSHRINSAN